MPRHEKIIVRQADINRASRMIKKSHYKEIHKVLSYWRNYGGLNINDNEKDKIRYYLKAIKKARKLHPSETIYHDKTHYYVHIFSPFRHAYQMDLIDQSRDAGGGEMPKYWYMFINVNTKYAFAYPIDSKTTNDCLIVLKNFLRNGDPDCMMLTSDEERAFVSKAFEDYCKKRGVSQRIITQQNHTALSIVDRLIRELRDMNTPPRKDMHKTTAKHKQSDDPKYRDFTRKRMRKLIDIHNHTTRNMWNNISPHDMQNDPGKEEDYILYKLYEREREKGVIDWEIDIDENNPVCVRYILQRKNGVKPRYKVSREYYKVVGKEGYYYVVRAEDGKSMTLPRWRLLIVTGEDLNIYSFAKTIRESNRYLIERIEDFVNGRYRVKWVGWDQRTDEPISNVRTRGSSQTKKEKEFWASPLGQRRKREMGNVDV